MIDTLPTIEVHLTRADMDAEWERNNGPYDPHSTKVQIACRPCSVLAREKANVSWDYVLDRVEAVNPDPALSGYGRGGYKVFFVPKPEPPLKLPEQNLSIENLF